MSVSRGAVVVHVPVQPGRPRLSGTAEAEGTYAVDHLTQRAGDPSEGLCPFALALAVNGRAVLGALAQPGTDRFRPVEATPV